MAAPNSATLESNQFIVADEEYDEDSIPGYTLPQPSPNGAGPTTPGTAGAGKGKGRAPEQLAPPSNVNELSGRIGTPSGSGSRSPNTNKSQTIAGVRLETRYTGVDSLDEPVTTTLARDLLSIYSKVVQVLWPRRKGQAREVLRDWDLWGPFIFCLSLAIMLSINAPPTQSLGVFTGVVVIVSVGSVIITFNAKLLGGRVSFFQSLCALGYCIFPLVVAALVGTFVHILLVRLPVTLVALAWSVWASVNFLDGTHIETQRILLAVYPQCLFYFVLAWMILIQ
ncbi:Yip1-domain-containing protein [Dacryopinax primogenitus]|uniref:Protein YIP n=1 Tax=Dacryopinax primogenitus (strain DJM 731) TaxID=1858805 RepID=M5G3J5_DACPD|nr:Yip1-domain-containing protein [Dacryopinax primogenitus]EJU04801.1 Yip1-domain-containing protein [Dacryopinax primogenitus]